MSYPLSPEGYPVNKAGIRVFESRNKTGFARIFDGFTETGRLKFREVETLVKAFI